MKKEEALYIKILIWAYRKQDAGFLWKDLVTTFDLTVAQDQWVQKVFRSNMPISDNLVDYLSHDSQNQGLYVITARGTSAAIEYLNLKEAENSGRRAEKIALFAIGIGIVTGIAQIIVQIYSP